MQQKFKHALWVLSALLGTLPAAHVRAEAQDPFLGQIQWVAFNFVPRGWASCDGQILSISQNTALFSLLGTTYGGNGQTTFALPDMKGRVLVNAGQGPGLSNYDMGQSGGVDAVTLTAAEIPAHTHTVGVATSVADQTVPNGNVLAQAASGSLYGTGGSGTVTMAAGAVSAVGGQPHNNMMPYNTLKCIIAVQGVFPPRN